MKKKIIIALIAVVVIAAAILLGIEYAHEQSVYQAETDIPKLYLDGNINNMQQKTDVRDITFSYSDGKSSFSGFAELKVQGKTSLQFDKKNYTIKLYRDS